MGRGKAAVHCNIRPWLSAKADCKEGRFIQIGNSLLLSEQMGKLKPGARYLYLCMTMEAGGKREFTFPASSAEKYHIPPSSFDRFKAELIDAGLKTHWFPQNGGSGFYVPASLPPEWGK